MADQAPTTNKTDETFPYPSQTGRLNRYARNGKLYEGEHFDAFSSLVNNARYGEEYQRLKYIAVNLPGMVSKIVADLLFGTPPTIKVQEGGNQNFIDNLIFENQLEAQFYENALGNSHRGDALFRVRIDTLPENDKPSVIVEDLSPCNWFPHINKSNFRAKPEAHELAWELKVGTTRYVRKEIHRPGKIEHQLWEMKDNKFSLQVPWDRWPSIVAPEDMPEAEVEDTKIKRSLIIHVPNYRNGKSFFGADDYADLMSLFYAVNNRMTKTENILDKHSDPILALPEGVLDEEGNVRKEAFTMFEIPNDGVTNPQKPEYIVWNASLDSNFKHIELLLKFMYMTSETSPAAFGDDESGAADSGKALKLKLLRTLAKVKRKRIYYNIALKELFLTAQELAIAHGLESMGAKANKAVMVDIDWQDGIPVDTLEAAQEEEVRLSSGTTTKKDAIMRLDGLDEAEAEKKAKEIEEENKVSLPTGLPTVTMPGQKPKMSDDPLDKSSRQPTGKDNAARNNQEA